MTLCTCQRGKIQDSCCELLNQSRHSNLPPKDLLPLILIVAQPWPCHQAPPAPSHQGHQTGSVEMGSGGYCAPVTADLRLMQSHSSSTDRPKCPSTLTCGSTPAGSETHRLASPASSPYLRSTFAYPFLVSCSRSSETATSGAGWKPWQEVC